ncbi:metal ABC transporter permease [Kaistia dalseonensis]|uniref:Zinc/manganese transport system permease protein n=1 Tax=Kaistia dalseonensis TaxID=410840 RepID=A0ABU0H8P5_9HYPH|nr:metal ABC transporter permease [Kaistia dalseonensis]MCX5495245.1 metal ABC transporter permease [Kaistia dalseonensis]MDQ0437831.1 zinc/manganese transport system permease protein [Kaistia dalseonensis]
MTAYDLLVGPFVEFGFMRRALIGCVALSLSGGPIGVFLVLRRMSLMGDVMAHAILPGAAIGFLLSGFSLFAMTLGGVVAGLAVALGAGAIARSTPLREDASFAAFYLVSLGLGVLIVSLKGSNIDLLHVLFGNVLALDDPALYLIAGIATVTLLTLALIYRLLVAECFDPGFLQSVGGAGGLVHFLFLALVVLNLVGGFNALGTLMVVGLIILPAASAQFWSETVAGRIMAAVAIGMVSSLIGLLVSFHTQVPTSPAIILAAGVIHAGSILVGRHGSFLRQMLRTRHLRG